MWTSCKLFSHTFYTTHHHTPHLCSVLSFFIHTPSYPLLTHLTWCFTQALQLYSHFTRGGCLHTVLHSLCLFSLPLHFTRGGLHFIYSYFLTLYHTLHVVHSASHTSLHLIHHLTCRSCYSGWWFIVLHILLHSGHRPTVYLFVFYTPLFGVIVLYSHTFLPTPYTPYVVFYTSFAALFTLHTWWMFTHSPSFFVFILTSFALHTWWITLHLFLFPHTLPHFTRGAQCFTHLTAPHTSPHLQVMLQWLVVHCSSHSSSQWPQANCIGHQ